MRARYGLVAGPWDEGISSLNWSSGCSVSSGSAGVRVQQPAEAGGADDLAGGGGVVHRRRFVPAGKAEKGSGLFVSLKSPINET